MVNTDILNVIIVVTHFCYNVLVYGCIVYSITTEYLNMYLLVV